MRKCFLNLIKDGWEIFIQYYWFDKYSIGFDLVAIVNGVILILATFHSCYSFFMEWLNKSNSKNFKNKYFYLYTLAVPFFTLHILRLAGAIYQQNVGEISDGCLSYKTQFKIMEKTPFGSGCLQLIGTN